MEERMIISKSPPRIPNPTEEQILERRNYVAVHWWIKKYYGKADKCTHPNCKKVSNTFDWALIKGKKYERNIQNFMMMCRRCHTKYDTTEELREKIRILQTGKVVSLEGRKRISDAGKKNQNATSKIINENTTEVYKSLSDAASKNNMSYRHLQYLLGKNDPRVSHLKYIKPKKNNK